MVRDSLIFAALLMLGVAGCGGDSEGSESPGGTLTDEIKAQCKAGCKATLAAACSNGPEDAAECQTDCEDLATGGCQSEYRDLQACSEGEEITCSSAGLPQIVACDAEQNAFFSCVIGI